MSCRRVCHWCFTTFWRLLWSITDQAHGKMESISIVQWRERKKLYIYIYIPASYHVTVRWSICATLQVTKATFRPSFFFSSLAYLHTVYPESFSTPFIENRIIAKSFPNLRVSMTSYGKFYKEFFQMRYFQVVKNTYCLGFSTFLICNQLPLNFFSWPSLAKSENVFFNLFQNRVILNTTKKTSCRALYMYLFV